MSTLGRTRQNIQTALGSTGIKLTEFTWQHNTSEVQDQAQVGSAGDLVNK